MEQKFDAQTMPDNSVIPSHTVQQVCAACGYDLTPEELEADKCADCGADLNIKRSVSIEVTTIPGFGSAGL